MRLAAKRRSTVSGPGPEPAGDPSCLESALTNFLSTVPEGLSRCRKSILPAIEGSPSAVQKNNKTPRTSQESPEKKQLKLQKEDGQEAKLENEEAERMREVTRKVLHYQKNKSCVDGTPRRSEREQDKPATPSTPQPRTRDFFFANNGDVGSPWTILSPLTCSQRNRQAHKHRLSLPPGDELDDGVWEREKANNVPNSSDQDSAASPSGGSASLPECPTQRALSQGPVVRSISVDETSRSPATAFRLGDLFQKGTSQRSYSSGSRTEKMRQDGTTVSSLLDSETGNRADSQVSTSGFISFFRRIGGRGKGAGDVEEQKDANT